MPSYADAINPYAIHAFEHDVPVTNPVVLTDAAGLPSSAEYLSDVVAVLVNGAVPASIVVIEIVGAAAKVLVKLTVVVP